MWSAPMGSARCQRVIALLREAGYERPIYLHGALAECCALYESFGVRLGPLKSATGAKRDEMQGRDRAGSALRRLPTAGRAGCPTR